MKLFKINAKLDYSQVYKFSKSFYEWLPHYAYGLIYHTTEYFDELTRDYIPRNADPPRDRGRIASGTLQSGFYYDIDRDKYYTKAIVGYVAYDTYKNQMYAERVHTHPGWKHPKRYPGHKPVYNFLEYSLKVNKEKIMQIWAGQFASYINMLSIK